MTEDRIHPSLLKRKIIHVDMDAYYASVEIRDNPALLGKPVIVGGPPNSRSVVCTASYPARKFGIHSAMPCSQAYRLCPQAIFLQPDFAKYSAVSQQIREIFQRHTSQVEPLSLDEAFLDVTANTSGLYASQIARKIKEAIWEETRLTCSAGVAPNKLLAKIASDFNKPNGITVVTPAQAESFMAPLELKRIPGVGPVTDKRFRQIGLVYCRDVVAWGEERLRSELDSSGEWLWEAAHGWDESPVDSTWERKSLGQEETFAQDILDLDHIKAEVSRIAREVALSLKERQLMGRTVTLKVKYADFTVITRAKSFPDVNADTTAIEEAALALLAKTEAGQRKVRLLGVSVSKLAGQTTVSLTTDLPANP